MKETRRYNWHPDLPDQRDYLFSERAKPAAAVPRKIDLRSECPPVANQGKIGSCTGNALAGALEFLELGELHAKSKPVSQVFTPGRYDPVSRLFIYYNERSLEGTTGTDGGAQLRDGIKSLARWGACRESLWKYVTGNVLKKPTPKAYTDGEDHRISEYLRIQSLPEMRQCLASGSPFVFGFAVYESFESPEVARTGEVPMPEPDERVLGGHAVCAVGYDDSERVLIVRNSWGPSWGDRGYFYLPYAYVDTKGLAQDFWVVRR